MTIKRDRNHPDLKRTNKSILTIFLDRITVYAENPDSKKKLLDLKN